MKDSKKEHRISNLKDMIDNVKDEPEEKEEIDDIEEDAELIKYLNQDKLDYDKLEIDDEYIYHPGDDGENAVNLEENPIDEKYIIKTPKEVDDEDDYDDMEEEIVGEISENFDNVINAKIKGRPILAIFSSVIGVILIIISIFIFQSRTERVVDNVVAGETSFMFVIFLIAGAFLLFYGVYRLFNIKNPFEKITTSINTIDQAHKDKKDDADTKIEKPSPKTIPKSKIPLDKDSYKIGEFDMNEIKSSLKKPTTSKKNEMPVSKDVDEIPVKEEKNNKIKDLSEEEIEEIEYEHAKLESESIDDIFAEVEDIEDVPIISIDSKEEKQ